MREAAAAVRFLFSDCFRVAFRLFSDCLPTVFSTVLSTICFDCWFLAVFLVVFRLFSDCFLSVFDCVFRSSLATWRPRYEFCIKKR